MAADKRSYTAGHFMLSLDGEPAVLKDFDGGNIKGEVVTVNMGPDNLPMKHISTLKFEAFTISVGMSMGKSLYEWIKASLDKQHLRKDGSIVSGSFDYKAMAQRSFFGALITEIGIPAFDASSKDTAFFTVKFDPEKIEYADGDGSDLKGIVNTKQKSWMCSNFRFRLGDLPCTRVNKIDAFTIKQTTVQDDVGEQRIATKEPGKLEIPNLKVTFSAADVKPWAEWFKTTVIDGAGKGDAGELSGAIEFMSHDMTQVLGSVDLFNVGIFSLNVEKFEANADKISRYTAELYVERMALNLAHV